MNKAQFEREKHFGAAMAIATRLLQSELITQSEYHRLTAVLTKKYRPTISSRQVTTSNPTPKNNRTD